MSWLVSLFVEDHPAIFLVMTVFFGGGAAFLAGWGLATKWRPVWQAVAYMVPLGLVLRFLHFALFHGDLLTLHYFLTDTLVLIAACLLGYRLKRVEQMTRQYNWLYERAGPLSWRPKTGA